MRLSAGMAATAITFESTTLEQRLFSNGRSKTSGAIRG